MKEIPRRNWYTRRPIVTARKPWKGRTSGRNRIPDQGTDAAEANSVFFPTSNGIEDSLLKKRTTSFFLEGSMGRRAGGQGVLALEGGVLFVPRQFPFVHEDDTSSSSGYGAVTVGEREAPFCVCGELISTMSVPPNAALMFKTDPRWTTAQRPP